MSKFFRFALLAGCGWLLDFVVLLLLVRVAGWPPLSANIVSSVLAASAVFLTSRMLVFERASGGLQARYGIFLIYTLTVIVVASFLVGAIAARVPAVAHLAGVAAISTTQAAAIAKVIVTPPQLLLNFVVSRMLSERPGLRSPATS